jgi:hypothetical protein
MKYLHRKRIISFGIFLIALAVALGFFFIARRPPGKTPLLEIAAASFEERDDPNARLEYEWLKYRDPATGEIPRDIRQRELSVAARIPTKESEQLRLSKSENSSLLTSANWIRRGPYNVGGRTRALAVDVNDTTIILAGGVSGGMWRSSNGGQSWLPTTAISELHSVTCLVQDKRTGKTSTWYYGTGELYGNSASVSSAPFRGDGLFKSTDNGVTWFRLMSTATFIPHIFVPPWDYVWNLSIDNTRTDSDVVYAATIGAILRSSDGGSTWQLKLGTTTDPAASPNGPFGPRLTDVIVTSSGVAYASLSSLNIQSQSGVPAINRGIWRSPDGISWTNITPADWPSGDYKRIVLAYAPSNPNVIFALAETPGTNPTGHSLRKYVYSSGNGSPGTGGGTWFDLSANLPNEGDKTGTFESQGSYDLTIAVKPDNENIVYIGGTNLYRSTDGWTTTSSWKRIGGYAAPNTFVQWDNHHCDQHVITFNPRNPSILLNGNDGGVYQTYDDLANSVQWTSLNNGYFNTQFYTIAIDHGRFGNLNTIGGMQDNGTYFTNNTVATAGWINEFGGDGAYCAIADSGTSTYVSSQQGNIYRFLVDDVGNYDYWAKVTPTTGGSFLFVHPFTLDPNNQRRMYLPVGNTLWRNNDLTGIPWYTSSTTTKNWDSLQSTRITGIVYTAVAVAKFPANRVYAGTSDGRVYRLENANVGSPTPVDIYSGKGLPIAYVNCIAADPSNGDKALLVFTNYGVQSIFSTTDAGGSWTPAGGNLEEDPATGAGGGPSVRWAAVLPPGGRTTYFVGTSVGLYSTTSLNGISTVWSQEGSSTIGNLPINMIDIRSSDGYIVAATHGGGVFSATLNFQVVVYPGDANNDAVVDVRDVLPIARFYGLTGPARGTASNTWSAQNLTSPWTPLEAGFADCDGNGVVDSSDVMALLQNWKATRAQGAPVSVDYHAAAEELLRSIDAQTTSSVTMAIRRAIVGFVERIGVPYAFSLEQNYPNPFNPSTNIRFTLPSGVSSASLSVFDIRGRLVWRQTVRDLAEGPHTTVWNGKTSDGIAAASGVYICRLSTTGQTAYRRMILLK